jgi:hypothetical protein
MIAPSTAIPKNRRRPKGDLGAFLYIRGWLVSGRYDMDARLSVAQAAAYFKVSKAVVNMWYVSGRLVDVTKNARGHRLYRFAELLAAERDTRRSPNSSRSAVRCGKRALMAA